ncbi:MAG: alpha/beta hydrolase family esterase [bacterium]
MSANTKQLRDFKEIVMAHGKLKNNFFAIILRVGLVLGFLAGFMACNNKDNPVEPVEKPTPGDYEISVKVDTMTRWFKLVIPPKYDHTAPRPLLLYFHGGAQSMDFPFKNRQDLIKRCEEENWILVFPNGANSTDNRSGGATWNAVHCCPPALKFDVDDIGFVRKIVDTLSVDLRIDAKRIYAMGGSNGGMFTHRLAAEMSDVFAAVAPSQATIGGQVDSLSPVVTVQPSQPIPIIMAHGLNDRTVNYHGGQTIDGDRIDISFRESALFWANNNQCTISRADTTVVNGLNGKVWIISFRDCNASVEVRAVTIENHGHGWPGLEESGYDGTNAMVDFLKQFSK